ncbi:hypothetical protein ACS0TY_028460 [Phlomoides rotata]
MGNPHVIVVPYPAQGHVIPMLELSQWLVKHGVKVTFVVTNFIHKRLVESLSESDDIRDLVTMVSIPDGMEPWEDRNDLPKLTEAILRVMPGELEDLIERERQKITCVIADWTMGWALEVAEKMGVRRAAFWPGAAAVVALLGSIPKLLSDGIIDNSGRALKNQTIRLSPNMPQMNSRDFVWATFNDQFTQIIFDIVVKNNYSVKSRERLICNSCYDLEPGAFSLFPDILPVGPLLAKNRLGKTAGHFWPEDYSCLAWLDQQPANSVIYVAFGSFTVFEQQQFDELALGLQLTNRPFLWVVRQDATSYTYPEGFEERVKNQGRMVGWAPQQQVLSHPSVACFISHCGWNSTMEGIGNGVPFLCWPYFADQFINQTYICNEWETGLGLIKDENGMIRREEIKDKVDRVLRDKSYKERALNLQAKAMDSVKEGPSHKNFNSFIEWIKE